MRSHSLTPALVVLFAVCVATTAAAQTPYSCPTQDCNLANKDFTTGGYHLVGANLSNAILTGANFTGLDLTDATLSGANLTSAKFNRATLKNTDLSATTLTKADFTGATLTKANFQFAKFDCTTFAESNISEAIFGPTLNLSTTSCRTSFAFTTMNCEFIGQWKELDLTSANISNCTRLSGADFTNAVMPGVVFSSDPKNPANLSGTTWRGANLAGANFTSANLTNADFSGPSDGTGAVLTNANLSYACAEKAKFDYASLAYDPRKKPPQPGARLAFACLVRASFTYADLRLTDFSQANVTGGNFAHAKLSGASFAGADAGGIDLTGATTLGVDMSNAYLANVNLKDMDFGPEQYETGGGAVTVTASSFVGALLCGAIVDHTNFNCANMTGANMTGASLSIARRIQGSDGGFTCHAVKFTNPLTNGVPPKGVGCFTICPNGTPGPCKEKQWSAGGVPACADGLCQ